jgi:hypothetical protein
VSLEGYDKHTRSVNAPAPLTMAEIAAKAPKTGGPIAGHSELVADGAGVSFATHICARQCSFFCKSVQIVGQT